MSEFHAWVAEQQLAPDATIPTAMKDLQLMEEAWNAALEWQRRQQVKSPGEAALAVMYLERAVNVATGLFAPSELMAMAQVHATLAVAAAMSAKEPLESYTAGFTAGRSMVHPLHQEPRWHGAEATPGQVIPRAADVLTPKWACTKHGWASNFTPCPTCVRKTDEVLHTEDPERLEAIRQERDLF